MDILRRVYADTLFLEALKKALAYFKFLRELLSKKGEPERVPVVPMGEFCNSILQSQSPSKLQDHGSFSILCCIGGMQIEGALCDLGASVSLMPLSLCNRFELLNLKPTTTLIQLANCTLR